MSYHSHQQARRRRIKLRGKTAKKYVEAVNTPITPKQKRLVKEGRKVFERYNRNLNKDDVTKSPRSTQGASNPIITDDVTTDWKYYPSKTEIYVRLLTYLDEIFGDLTSEEKEQIKRILNDT